MTVQAQYPSNAFSPNVRTRIQSNVLDEQLNNAAIQDHQFLGVYSSLGGISAPQSELTCNASASRKKSREIGSSSIMAQQQQQTPIQFRYQNVASFPIKTVPDPDQSRLIESAGASTSGRLAHDLVSQLYHQNIEIDALIRLQNERLRSGLEESRKRHCRALISVLDQQVMKRLKEKETELENASRRNAELEEKVRQMSAENQIWFNVAKTNEAIVSSLRSSLEQVLLQNTVYSVVKEGSGDSDGTPFPADDAQSCCFEGEEERANGGKTAITATERRVCKLCHERDVSVLLLPCRHLCLCKDCESKAETCPICLVPKNACLLIFMS